MNLLRTRKYPKEVKPSKRMFTFDIYFIRAGEVGTGPGMMSERGRAEMESIGRNLRAKHPDDEIALLWDGFERQSQAAYLVAKRLGVTHQKFDSSLLHNFITQESPTFNHLGSLMRLNAEESCITTFVIVASLPRLERVFPGKVIPEAACLKLTMHSSGQNMPFKFSLPN